MLKDRRILVGVTGAGILEQPVAAGVFAVNGPPHPFGEVAIVIAEVRQRGGHMRQTFEVLGSRLELHIDEDHDERLRRVSQRDPVAQRQKVFRLTRAGSADHHGVEPVAAKILGAQDDVLQFTAGPDADGHHRPTGIAPPAAVRPQPVDIQSTRIGDVEGSQQFAALGLGVGGFPGRGG